MIGTDISRLNGGTALQALIVRHAERFRLPSIGESLGVGVTERGKHDAYEMGRAINGFEKIRLFHSPALRCRETAEAIAQGFSVQGGTVQGLIETWDLCAPYLKDDQVLKAAENHGQGFLRSWFNGQFDPEWIKPTAEAADMILAPLLQRMVEGNDVSRLDIHVSHDWDILLLREELLGVRYEEAGWIGYLEGIHFSGQEGGFLASCGGRSAAFALSSGRRGR